MGNCNCCLAREKQGKEDNAPTILDFKNNKSDSMQSLKSQKYQKRNVCSSNQTNRRGSQADTASSSKNSSFADLHQVLAHKTQMHYLIDQAEFQQMRNEHFRKQNNGSKFLPEYVIHEGQEEDAYCTTPKKNRDGKGLKEDEEDDFQSVDLNSSPGSFRKKSLRKSSSAQRHKLHTHQTEDDDIEFLDPPKRQDSESEEGEDILAIQRKYTQSNVSSNHSFLKIKKVGGYNASQFDQSEDSRYEQFLSECKSPQSRFLNPSSVSSGSLTKVRKIGAQSGADDTSEYSQYTDTSILKMKSRQFLRIDKVTSQDSSKIIVDDYVSDNSSQYTLTSVVYDGKSDGTYLGNQKKRSSSGLKQIYYPKKSNDYLKLTEALAQRKNQLNQMQNAEQDEELFAKDDSLIFQKQPSNKYTFEKIEEHEEDHIYNPREDVEEDRPTLNLHHQRMASEQTCERLDKTVSSTNKDLTYFQSNSQSILQRGAAGSSSKRTVQSFEQSSNSQSRFTTSEQKVFDRNQQIVQIASPAGSRNIDLSALVLQTKSVPFTSFRSNSSKNDVPAQSSIVIEESAEELHFDELGEYETGIVRGNSQSGGLQAKSFSSKRSLQDTKPHY